MRPVEASDKSAPAEILSFDQASTLIEIKPMAECRENQVMLGDLRESGGLSEGPGSLRAFDQAGKAIEGRAFWRTRVASLRSLSMEKSD
jgi:hypothetical protein